VATERTRELSEAYDACVALAQSHYENFPVASRLLPAHQRPHVAAIYAFARVADDYADEPGHTKDERLRLLKDWRRRLHASGTGSREPGSEGSRPVPGSLPVPGSRIPAPDTIFFALHDTIERFNLPVQLFDDLIDAFMQDVTKSRYATWAEVFDYCRRSANPVGRLVLRLNDYQDDRLDRAADAVCTALQLTNFWQDLAIDWSRGRLYVPDETWHSHGADPQWLERGVMTPQWQLALRDSAARTRELFAQGRPVCDGVRGRLRYELRATWLGGTRILNRLERSGFDVFQQRPALGIADAIVIACGTLLWRETPRSPTRS
jgi:phytoene synthase